MLPNIPMNNNLLDVKPFLKWAGGKTQLIPDIDKYLKRLFRNNIINKYFEPFIGGGSIFLWVLSNYNIPNAYINDINENIYLCWHHIKNNINKLIEILNTIKEEYLALNEIDRKSYYYNLREKYNNENLDDITKSSYTIFLNKTCFNGLYRVNKNGKFNVPAGSYKQPQIFDPNNLREINKLLENVTITNQDYSSIYPNIDNGSLIYFDPPYRPISSTASFTSYSEAAFDDKEQERLAKFIERINILGAKFILSNSDPKNINADDDFFDKLYRSYDISRINAKRSINSHAQKRGHIKELVIFNI